MQRTSVILAVLLSALAVAAGHAQRPSAAQTVRGRIVAADTGQPLPNARIAVNGTSSATRADLDGRFVLAAPPTATVVVTKAGFVRTERRLADQPNATPIVEVRLPRSTAVSGRVTNEYGDGVVGATVFVTSSENGDQASSASILATTDDRGEYRIGGLPEGTYLVGVRTQAAGRTETRVETVGGRSIQSLMLPSLTTYFPGTADAREAARIRLAPGDDRQDVDFHLTAAQTARQAMSVYPSMVSLRDTNIPRNGSASVAGTIVSSSGRILAHAVVVLVNPKGQTFLTTSSNDDGRYEFDSLPPGDYLVLASKTGFSLPTEARSETPERAMRPAGLGLDGFGSNGVAVTVAADESRDRTDVTLRPWGALTGHVFDDAGEPVAGARVGLLVSRYEAGRRRLVVPGTQQRYTDDRGEFRIVGVPDGQYVLGASVIDIGRDSIGGYAPTYFPGTNAAAEARFITVAAGDDTKGLDVNLVLTPTARVTGRLIDAHDRPGFGGRFNLVSRSAVASRIDAKFTSDGNFEFLNVPPGQYVIQADRGRLDSATEGDFAAYPVTVGRSDVTGVVIQVSAGTALIGRVTYDSLQGAVPPQDAVAFSAVPLDFDLAPPSLAVADLTAENMFRLAGITGTRRVQATRLPPNWMVKSIVSDGVDVTDQALEFGKPTQSLQSFDVVLTDRVNIVSGTITDDRGRRVPGTRVVVFSADRDRWYPMSRFVRSAVSGGNGAFSIDGMPAGSYFVVAALSVPPGEEGWRDPVFLDSLRSSARSISVGEGDSQTVNVAVSSR